jgi:hypothetical protein
MIAREVAWPPAVRILLVAAALAWLLGDYSHAQTAAAEAATAEASPQTAAALDKLSDDEVDALVTRIALYPDPLLAAVLQASTLPIQIVEANRFLERRAKDPKAAPKLDWDSSITALLNYASVVAMMNDDLEWTQTLGEAALNQLGDVQDSIQQFRAEVQAAGLLKSDDKQTVTAEGDTIKIVPAQPDVIYVPMYDGPALAAALAAPPAPAAPAPAPEANAAAGSAAMAPEPQAAAPAVPASPGSYGSAPAGAAADGTTVAGGATVVYPPAYPPAYPPPAYAPPQPSFWTPGASFVGGAVVGGLLGYAIGEDDDDIEIGDGYGGGRNVSGNRTVSGNTVNVVAPNTNRREVNNQTQAALQQRSGQATTNSTRAREARAQVNQTGGAGSTARASATPASARAANPQRAANTQAAQSRSRPDQASGAGASRARTAQQPAAAQATQSSGALGNASSGREARKESARGAESRASAQSRPTSASPQQRQGAAQQAQQRPQREASAGSVQDRPAGGGAFANQSSGSRAAQQSSRGAASRSGGGASGGGGGGGGGRAGGGRR